MTAKDKPAVQDPTTAAVVTPEPLAPTDPGFVQPPRTNVVGPDDARRDV